MRWFSRSSFTPRYFPLAKHVRRRVDRRILALLLIGLSTLTVVLMADIAHRSPLHALTYQETAAAVTQTPLTLASDRVVELETSWGEEYDEHLKLEGDRPTLTADQIIQRLGGLNQQTGKRTALIYALPKSTELELILVLPNGSVIRRGVRDASRNQLTRTIRNFRREITLPTAAKSRQSFPAAQRLYHWLITPVEPMLKAARIDLLVFCAGPELRSLPFAALYDGQHFLTETYGTALIPAFSLTDSRYQGIHNARVLAMGASEFQSFDDLPGVPSELNAIAQTPWPTESALNQQFTLENLRQGLQTRAFQIVHLATHAQFKSGDADQSFIQLWQDETLTLDQLQHLDWSNSDVELLVLSACQTALGDRQAELGFAGVSFYAGVKSTVASLWRVSDLGTFVLMKEFYAQLANPAIPTKAEALRQAQQTLLSGQVYIQDGLLHSPTGDMTLPPEFDEIVPQDFTQPYHWASFMLVGSPW